MPGEAGYPRFSSLLPSQNLIRAHLRHLRIKSLLSLAQHRRPSHFRGLFGGNLPAKSTPSRTRSANSSS
jgi:hypothetical protein